jgi:hypothetical protein
MAQIDTNFEKLAMSYESWREKCLKLSSEATPPDAIKGIAKIKEIYKEGVNQYKNNDIPGLIDTLITLSGWYGRLSELSVECGYDFVIAYTYRKISYQQAWRPMKEKLAFGDYKPTINDIESGLADFDAENRAKENASQMIANTLNQTLKFIEMMERNFREALSWLKTEYYNSQRELGKIDNK